MTTDDTLALLERLKLPGMADSFKSLLTLGIHQRPSIEDALARLALAEELSRNERRTTYYLNLAKLRYSAQIEQIKCGVARNFSADQLQTLAEGSWIRRAENVLITGATGCGKSYLACALGARACQLGFKTIYLGMARLLEKIGTAKFDQTYVIMLDALAKTDLLILDDFGLHEITHTGRIALLQILEDRYGKGATIITSQIPIEHWYDYLNEPTLADAIIDRLAAKAHKIELKGESMRRQTSPKTT